ncbi:glycoside hydrolase family 27 protein [Massilia genomosp. 1]|uniref:glycoside hydrolase family 27 protein n=1 Tax=Massilia genomosp. 1 TaxID=2609280 RepID=UPI001E57E216|nr:glycoside hydrolase family 27 protein [Massilia genomosp. 1]
MKIATTLLMAAALLPGARASAQKFDTLAATPQMGWNSWNRFACNIDEKLIRETVDAMVRIGMKDAGYEYVNIDDCWHGKRDKNGNIEPDPVRFPSGMKALADYVHAKGLKLGIYSDAGATTCGGRPGSRGHEYQDAISYANWGIDYVKCD